MSTLWQDVRFAVRTLRRRPLVTLLATFSLALAIGGNGAVFSLIDALIFRPLPYPEPERVVLAGEREKSQPEFTGSFTTSLANYADWTERSRLVDRWAAMQPVTLSLRGSEQTEPVQGVRVTRGFFELLGATPTRGRLFTRGEDVEGAPRVVLLSDEWRVHTYGEEHDPIGETLVLDGEPHRVIGVLPEGFGFLTPNQDVWVPMARSVRAVPRDQRDVLVLGRLAEGATMEAVRAEMVRIAEGLEAEQPEAQRGWTVDTYNLRHDVPNRQSRLLFGLLQGSVLLVLVIACVNVTNLLLARGQERSLEIALRTTLGAGRGRIVRQLMTETSLMVAAGALLGLGIAALGVRALSAQFAAVLPATWAVRLDARVLLFTLALTVATGLVFGLVPALQTLRAGQAQALKEGGGRGGAGKSRKLVSRALVIGEIALSFVALGGGSLLVRSFLQIRASDPGFEAGRVLTAAVRAPDSRYPDDEAQVRLADELLERASLLGMVEASALATVLPQSGFATTDTFRIERAANDDGTGAPRAVVVDASPGYPATMGIGMLQGRFLESTDRLDSEPVAVVNRTLAERHLGGASAVGAFVTVRGTPRRVVGVIEDVQQVLMRASATNGGETVYLPIAQEPSAGAFLVVRTRAAPGEAAEPLRQMVRDVDRDVVVSRVLTMEEYVEQFFVGVQVFNAVLGGFGLVALLLASLGTYGVLAYSVSRRGHEISIRMALGAEARQVVRMIARQGLWLGVLGLGIGVLLTLPLVGVLRSLLQGISTVQPATLGIIAAVLMAVTMAATLVPARRAAGVDPMRTLRQE